MKRGAHTNPALGLALLGVLAFSGCRQLAGIDDREADRDAAASCGALPSGACGSCVESACCDLVSSCGSDSACNSAWYCFSKCADGDEACRTECRSKYAAGLGEKLDQVLACQSTHCSAECGLACGGWVHPSTACAACSESACCAEASACAGDAECWALSRCIRGCSSVDFACIGDCTRAHEAGYDKAAAFSSCIDQSCRDICGYAKEWGCVGKRPSPAPTDQATMSFLFQVRAPGSNGGIPDVDVSACDQTNVDCKPPLATGKTDANGVVSFTLPNGFAGYMEVSSAADPPAVIHSIVYVGPPQYGSGSISWSGLSPSQVDLIQKVAPATLPGTAVLLLQANGCTGSNTGASFALDAQGPGVLGFYIQNGVPTPASAQSYETDSSGAGGFVNVPVGAGVVATWSVHATGEVIQKASLAVRANSVTYDLNW